MRLMFGVDGISDFDACRASCRLRGSGVEASGPSLSGRSVKALGQGEEPEASSDEPDDGNVLVRGSGAARRGLADLIQQTHNFIVLWQSRA